MQLRTSAERGHANHGWLDSYHTFSFASYRDPAHMGFRALRVINDDRIAADQGFGTHPHDNMEILTYMLEGELAHRDSMGNGRVIKTGEVQGMSAGTGITHSEFNASAADPAHLLQIWIIPAVRGVAPSYGEWRPDGREKEGWALAASPDGSGGSIRIHQDARMVVATPAAGQALDIPIPAGRYGWLQIGTGSAELDGQALAAGDGVSFAGGEAKLLRALSQSRIVLFDLA